MRRPLRTLAAAALLAGGCSYDFQNPAERLDAGEVSGRVVADLSGTGDLAPVANVTVRLKGSSNVQYTRENGRFFLLGAIPGRHTLLFEKGTWAYQRDIEVGFGADGQIEGVVLGDVRLRYAVTLGGAFTPPSGYSIDPFPFAAPTGVAVDEATGATATVVPEQDPISTAYTGRFLYTFAGAPVGPHRIRFAITAEYGGLPVSWVGGPLTQNLPETSEGQTLTLAQTPLRFPDPFTPGKLRFRVAPSVGAPAFDVLVTDLATGLTIGDGSPANPYPAPDSTGWVEVDLPEGQYSVALSLGAGGGLYEVPAAVTAVVVADQTTDLGALYIVNYDDVFGGAFACLGDSDCSFEEACVDGTCQFRQPMALTRDAR